MWFLTSREQVAPQGIGKTIRRREDARLLTGGGRFADDMRLPGQVYAYMVRSPHAHALIASIDTGRRDRQVRVDAGEDRAGLLRSLWINADLRNSRPAHADGFPCRCV